MLLRSGREGGFVWMEKSRGEDLWEWDEHVERKVWVRSGVC